MMRDPIELLREANPVAAELLSADPVERVHMEQLFERIASPAPVTGRRPKRRVIVAVAIATVALLAGAAAYIVHRQRVTEPLDIGCYEMADLRARVFVVSVGNGEDPVVACTTLWQKGTFGTPTTPRLESCVLPSGAVGVFPGESEDVCERLGRPAPAPTSSTTVGSTSLSADPVELRNTLVAQFVDRCLTEPQARAIVQGELQRRRMPDWNISDAEAFTADRPCATLRVDVEAKTILLIPFVKPG
jgi:hypothetical protein